MNGFISFVFSDNPSLHIDVVAQSGIIEQVTYEERALLHFKLSEEGATPHFQVHVSNDGTDETPMPMLFDIINRTATGFTLRLRLVNRFGTNDPSVPQVLCTVTVERMPSE